MRHLFDLLGLEGFLGEARSARGLKALDGGDWDFFKRARDEPIFGSWLRFSCNRDRQSGIAKVSGSRQVHVHTRVLDSIFLNFLKFFA